MGYQTVSTEDRYSKIIMTLRGARLPMTASQICRIYVGQYTTSDVNSTGQILKILSLAGKVKRTETGVPGRRKTIITYELVES